MKQTHVFKRLCVALLCGALLLPTVPAQAQTEDRLSFVATNFPAYDLARALSCGTADIKLLLPPGSESHSYEPSPQDIIAIQNADLFLYTGGESDHWVEEILRSLGSDAPRAFRMADHVALLNEELSRSMQAHPDHEQQEHEEAEIDEHVWTSPRNVMEIARALNAELCTLAPMHSVDYTSALSDYLSQLTALDEAFVQIVAQGKRDLIIFGDRFPFRYFAATYGLRYDAAFPGCSEDSEPSVRTVVSLIDTVREQHIPVIFYIEYSSCRTADILVEETGAQKRLFHSCHTVSAEEMANGATYLSLMWQNADALKEALS